MLEPLELKDYEITIFSYDDGNLCIDVIRNALESKARKITLIGGGKLPYEFINGIRDPRFKFIKQEYRIGKPKSVRKAIEILEHEIVVMVSGDVVLPENAFDRIIDVFQENTGAVFCKIEPIMSKSFFSKLSYVLWDVHDMQIKYLLNLGLPAHAGEILAVRRQCTRGYRGEVNDDAFFCISAKQLGLNLMYLENLVVKCKPPKDLNDFIRQRRRIDFGHVQLRNEGMEPYVISILSWKTVNHSFNIFINFMKRNKNSIPYFFILTFLELFISSMSRIDTAMGKQFLVWDLISR